MDFSRQSIVALLALLFCTVTVHAADPVVSNIRVEQRTDGSGLVDILYDVDDPDGDNLTISLQMSDDSGLSWEYPVLNVSGDIGSDVQSGVDRAIVWDVSAIAGTVIGETFRVRVIASDCGVEFYTSSPALLAITDWGIIDWNDYTNIEKYSRADLFLVMAAQLWGDEFGDVPVVDQIKSLNPDIKIVGYVSAKTAKLSGASETANSFWREWYLRTKPFWVYTTEGDTASDWPGNVLLNILNPDCREIMIDTVEEFQNNSVNKLDGILWDYFANSLWIYSGVDVDGEPDMDGNGLPHANDPDERIAFRNSHVSLINELRERMGESFIQIFNGPRAHGDAEFAALADGMMYELFPTQHFPDPDMATSLDQDYAHNLYIANGWMRTQNGGPYLVMSNPWTVSYTDTNSERTRLKSGNLHRAVALMMDGYSSWNSHDGDTFAYTYGWPDVPVTLGPATGPPEYEGDFIRREFKYGRVEIEMGRGSYPNPFAYRIWALGQLVEELDVPIHYP